jgi:hypothetical protein
MKYKVSKEELDALFREVYSTDEITEGNYTLTPLKRKEELKFLAYKYKAPLKSFLISNLPAKIFIKSFEAYEGNRSPEENIYITGFDVEKKYRLYITISEDFESIIQSKISSDINKILENNFNIQNFINLLSEHLIFYIKKDFPFSIKKINHPSIQFYEDEFVKLEYKLEVENSPAEISILIEKNLIEAVDISPFLFSPPTTTGRKKLRKLKELIKLNHIILSDAVNINIKDLKAGK